MRNMRVVLVLSLLSLLVSGCWDQVAIEDTAYVTSFGVDAADDEYLWTFRIAVNEGIPVGMLNTQPQPAGELSSGLTEPTHSASALVQPPVVGGRGPDSVRYRGKSSCCVQARQLPSAHGGAVTGGGPISKGRRKPR